MLLLLSVVMIIVRNDGKIVFYLITILSEDERDVRYNMQITIFFFRKIDRITE